MNTIKTTRRLVESAVMIALGPAALSFISVVPLPFGGSVTIFSQLPIVLIAYRYKTRWGLLTGAVMGVIQMVYGMKNFTYVSGITAILVVAFVDYLGAFAALGLGGLFKGKLRRPALEIALGAFLGSAVRFVCHAVSGATVWSGYTPEGETVLHYTLTYNAGYMLPETVLTVIGAVGVALLFDLTSPDIKPRRKIQD